jgi:hypothetical protein
MMSCNAVVLEKSGSVPEIKVPDSEMEVKFSKENMAGIEPLSEGLSTYTRGKDNDDKRKD